MLSASSLVATWYASLQQVQVSEPLWIATWGFGLIGVAMLSRSFSARSQSRR